MNWLCDGHWDDCLLADIFWRTLNEPTSLTSWRMLWLMRVWGLCPRVGVLWPHLVPNFDERQMIWRPPDLFHLRHHFSEKKKKNNNKLIKKFLTCKKINQQFRCHLKTKTLFQKFGSPLWTLQKNEKNFHSIAICQ